jgi:hypothetical protein
MKNGKRELPIWYAARNNYAERPEVPAVHDGYAIASLVLGLCWVWGIGAILALIFGLVSNSRAHAEGRQSSGMAIAGIILGSIGLVSALFITVVVIIAATHSSTCVAPDGTTYSC